MLHFRDTKFKKPIFPRDFDPQGLSFLTNLKFLIPKNLKTTSIHCVIFSGDQLIILNSNVKPFKIG